MPAVGSLPADIVREVVEGSFSYKDWSQVTKVSLRDLILRFFLATITFSFLAATATPLHQRWFRQHFIHMPHIRYSVYQPPLLRGLHFLHSPGRVGAPFPPSAVGL
jgi:hypothetical protein